ncbi:MAG: DNA glycosylase AlkZ-like family protein, partial [Candidatus Thorarchaeota archaeon]
MIEVAPEQARSFMLDVQGLRTEKPSKSVTAVARRIHNIQIDTISVVSRSHNLITYNRFAGYKEGKIWDALKKGQLFEYWSHAMCLIPIEAYPFYAWKMQHYPEKLWSNYMRWAKENEHVIDSVYKHVKKYGATASATVGGKNEGEKGWWGMKAERMALEFLHIDGSLMIAYRKGFQKYYDLPE